MLRRMMIERHVQVCWLHARCYLWNSCRFCLICPPSAFLSCVRRVDRYSPSPPTTHAQRHPDPRTLSRRPARPSRSAIFKPVPAPAKVGPFSSASVVFYSPLRGLPCMTPPPPPPPARRNGRRIDLPPHPAVSAPATERSEPWGIPNGYLEIKA